MSNSSFSQARIVGVSAAVPKNIKTNSDLFGGEEEIKKTAKLVGVEQRHIADNDLCSSDLCYFAANKLLDELSWERDSIDALIFLSQTPDYRLPATSCILQDRLGLSKNCAAFDMNLGCSGYVYGLLVAHGLISGKGIKRVLLLVGETVSKLISPYDVGANVLFGDAGTATALEYDPMAKPSFFEMGTDGSGYSSLIIEAGGFRSQKSEETATRKEHPRDGVLRSEEEFFMDGSAVYSFTISQIPILVNELLKSANKSLSDIDAWLFHQANKFMLNYIIEKSGISKEKAPMNIQKFGNTSPASLPLLMVSSDISDELRTKTFNLALIGFGVGLSWGGVLLETSNLIIPKLILVENGKAVYES